MKGNEKVGLECGNGIGMMMITTLQKLLDFAEL